MSFCDDQIASAEEVAAAIASQDKQLQKALQDLEKVSHLGSYKDWLVQNKPLFQKLKVNNPIAYNGFLEKFTAAKNKLETRGVTTNDRK